MAQHSQLDKGAMPHICHGRMGTPNSSLLAMSLACSSVEVTPVGLGEKTQNVNMLSHFSQFLLEFIH